MSDTTVTESSTQTTEAAPQGGADATAAPADTASGQAGDDATVLGAAEASEGTGGPDGDGEQGKGEAAPADGAGVPDAYELKSFTVGEGDDARTVEIDSGLLDEITPGLKGAGVTQEMLDKLAPTVVPAIQQRVLTQMEDRFSETRSNWAKEAQADPEMGGKNWSETLQLAAKALDHFGAKSEKDSDGKETNPFRVLLNESGIGNHPVMLRMFRNVGAAIGEDTTFVRNTSEQAVPKAREEKNYPDDIPKSS